MRIKDIQLTWFRGAADSVALEPNCKSMVVYGVNGSGKSSFVDAVEYMLCDGRIGHLSHEYSGKRQERAILNTHKPTGRNVELKIDFEDGSELKTVIHANGSRESSGAEGIAIHEWDYRRTVLRQNEVAEFIHATKGDKYSALLPLLGLRDLEIAAENLRQLAKTIETQSKLREAKTKLIAVNEKRVATFGEDTDEQILATIQELHTRYCEDKPATEEPLSRCNELKASLEALIASSSDDQRQYAIMLDAAKLDLTNHIDAVRTANGKLAGSVELLVTEKLDVLQSTGGFVKKLKDEKEVECPACGRSIPVDSFRVHVEAERTRLREIIDTFDTRKAAIGTLSDTVKSLKSNLNKGDLKSWRDELKEGPLAANFTYLDAMKPDALRTTCGESDLKEIELNLTPLIEAASVSSKDAPPDAQQLSTDKQSVETGRAVIVAVQRAAEVARAEDLVSFTKTLEKGVREEIKLRSQAVIGDITADIQSMWATLHPGELIEDVRLYLPEHADKAIDIGLKFFGVELESPRLTLSEGYRNSLGLCIFLAMAKHEADTERPLFLDDVVVSLDRNHRGMIVDVLMQEFDKRQVVILTHDREWYTELRQQLPGKEWIFKALLPYETPEIGIRWSDKSTTFDDARSQVQERPDAAGTDARKIMDVECALIAQGLRIRLPYLRGDRNDKRMAHEFMERFIADGQKCFQKKAGKNYEGNADAITAFRKTDQLLVSWANRASHTFDLVRPEANKLISTCEQAIESFRCSSCKKNVWFADVAKSEWVQCQCGELRWRYGKG